jgi:hypothetical protein
MVGDMTVSVAAGREVAGGRLVPVGTGAADVHAVRRKMRDRQMKNLFINLSLLQE